MPTAHYTDANGVVRLDMGTGELDPACVSEAVATQASTALDSLARYRFDIEFNIGSENADVLIHSVTAV